MASYHYQQDASAGCCIGDLKDDWWGRRRKEDAAALMMKSQDGTDAKIAKEMHKLSVQEREQIYEDIHGVAVSTEETPQFVTTRLAAFDLAISDMTKPKRRLLGRAIFLNQLY